MTLKDNYKDYISKTEDKKYSIRENGDGTHSITDVTEYTQVGDDFGAKDVNTITNAVNNLGSAIIFSTSNVTSGVTTLDIPNINNYGALIVRCGPSANNSVTVTIPVTSNAGLYQTGAYVANDSSLSVSAQMRLQLKGSALSLQIHWSNTWEASVFRIFEVVAIS